MHTLLKTLIIAATLAVVSLTTAKADGSVNPIVGTWTLNLAKSKYDPGPPPQSLTRTYAETSQGLSLTWKGTQADGQETVGSKILRLDGKDYPALDAPDYDTMSSTKIDRFTIAITQKRKGRTVETLSLVVSKNEKIMVLHAQGIDANGVAFSKMGVYDRQ